MIIIEVMSNFKKYEKFLKRLNKAQKREFKSTARFLQTAMVCEMVRTMDRKYTEFFDDYGQPEFYEIAMEICDEILFSNDSEFLKYYKLYLKGKADDYFYNKLDTCMDWYHMDLAREELIKRMGGFIVEEKKDAPTLVGTWIDQLKPIINEYKDGDINPLTETEVSSFTKIIKAMVDLHEDNITQEQYNKILG